VTKRARFLNVQGSSYALRSYLGPGHPRRWRAPGCPTTHDLLPRHEIIHQEDAGSGRRKLDDIAYWVARVTNCNNKYGIGVHGAPPGRSPSGRQPCE
jgi:hypothetical protein